MSDPIGSEAIVAKEAIIAFASWLVNAKKTAIADVVHELEVMLRAAFERGRESVDREKLKQNVRRSEADIDRETERELIDHG